MTERPPLRHRLAEIALPFAILILFILSAVLE